jgi:large subunit ribosomal protein L4
MNIFDQKKKAIGLIHKVYLAYLKTSRKYTASTKTKSEVRGGGRKPWKQKGTGQARAGSNRSPLWVGGGVIFGPKPRKVFKKINKKEKRVAILSALFLKKSQFIILEDKNLEARSLSFKTKDAKDFLASLGITGTMKTLVLLNFPNKFLWLSMRNLKNIEVGLVQCINLQQILKADKIVLSKTSFEQINQSYGKF